MNRMGMVDFWYYVNEEFHFKNGHMLLRGSNGSGKSVTMQSFIPLLLDGNKSSERLDPFGTRSRKIENYLLEENSERSDRIGYLYMEFKREDSDVYKTIGIGLHARKGKNLDSWYFVIEDHKRINHDVMLLDHNLAITKQMLKNAIGEHQVIDSQKAYMEKVNQALFGFKTSDEYKEAIALLLQLRSPKLSNSLKPSTINEILSASLQPLSEDDLRPMSEAITNMDNIKDQLDALNMSFQSAKSIYHVFAQYAHAVLFDKLHKYQKEEQLYVGLQKDIADGTAYVEQQLHEKGELDKTHKALLQEQALLTEEKKSLGNHDVLRLSDECEDLRKTLQEETQSLAKKEQQEEQKANTMQDVKGQRKIQKDQGDLLLSQIQEYIEELDVLNENLQFEEHVVMRDEVSQHLEETYDFAYTHNQLDDKLAHIDEGIQIFQEYDLEAGNRNRIVDDIAKQESQIEHEEGVVKALEEQYDNMVEEYKETISTWNHNNLLLKLTDSRFHTIMEYLHEYEEQGTYFKILKLVDDQYQFAKEEYLLSLNEEKRKQQDILQAIYEKQEELQSWKDQKDPQPWICEAQQKNRNHLQEQDIPYRSFYSILEFDEEMEASLRDTIEEVFTRLGILDALLVEKRFRDKVCVPKAMDGIQDNYMFVDVDTSSIAPFSIQGKTIKEVEASLQSILQALGCESFDSIYLDTAYFQSGIVLGTLTKEQRAMYVGKETRQILREQMIQKLMLEKDELEKQNQKTKNNLYVMEQKLQRLKEEHTAFPQENDLHLALREYKAGQQMLDTARILFVKLQQQEEACNGRLQELGKKLQVVAGYLAITLRKEVFLEQKENYQEYKKIVLQIQTQQTVFIKTLELVKTFDLQIENLFLDINELHAENEKYGEQIALHHGLLSQKQKQLDAMGYEDICRRLREIDMALERLPHELTELNQRIGAIENAIVSKQENVEKLQKLVQDQQQRAEVYYRVLEDEAKLGYVALQSQGGKNMIQEIVKIEKTYSVIKSADNLKTEVQNAYYTHRGYLQEYHLTILSDDQWENLENVPSRLDIGTKYKGNKITFPQLLTFLEGDIQLQSNLLIDSDRHLFEDILVNILSKKVRIRIQNSRDWVNHMNTYMNAMNTSSGLRLNLQWKSKKAETSDELDTKQLVEILEKDQRVVKESDLEKLSVHFRSKIANARNMQNMDDNNLSFHQLMREIMDYRQWYEFKIMAQKNGEGKKELTNNAFYAFSGGEKAMAMYVPLFSAVAAKFKSAREDAPLLIALDEAFAGVDEKNIDNMFALIEKFKFDYIMNSQVLWGDYPSVKALAIYELFRPENARFVTTIPYIWDGHVKRMRSDL